MPILPMLTRPISDDVEAPSSVQAEITLLGAMQLYPELIHKARLVLRAKDFSLESHQTIFSALASMDEAEEDIDLITLSDHLKSRKKLDGIGGPAYLAFLTEYVPRDPAFDAYLKIVKDQSLLRRMMSICYAGLQDTAGNPAEIVDRLQVKLAEIAKEATCQVDARRNLLSGGMRFAMEKNAKTDWLVDGLIQRNGNGLIVASPGVGKSWVVLDLGMHIATGTTWMGHVIQRPANVAIISREDSPDLTQSRMHALINGANEYFALQMHTHNLDGCFFVNTRAQMETFSLQRESDIQEIIANLKENNIELAFFDVFRRLWEGDENDNREVAKVLATLTRIQNESGAAIALVHHLSKGDGSVFDRIRGSTSIYGWREWAFGCTVENIDAPVTERVRKILFETKADAPADPLYFKIDSTPGKVKLMEAEEPQQKSRTRRKGEF